MKAVLTGLTMAVLVSGYAQAEAIERACLKSDRKEANRMLCGCIQDVANLTLSNSEQRRAAGFFADPHKAQTTRQSDSRRDEVFWGRYQSFGKYAQEYCG